MIDYFRKRRRRREIDGSNADALLREAPAPAEEHLQRLDRIVEVQFRDAALREAAAQLQDEGHEDWWAMYDAYINSGIKRKAFAEKYAEEHGEKLGTIQQRITRITDRADAILEKLAGQRAPQAKPT